MNRPHDDLSILVTLKANGTVEKSVTGSIMESLALDSHDDTQFSRLKEIFAKDSLQMCTFTITEKGYNLNTPDGNFMGCCCRRYEKQMERPESYIMDNCSHNGDKLKLAITTFAKEWAKNGVVEEGFVSYVEDENKVSFPWTMIDKITPRPDASIEALLQKDDIEGLDPVITSKNTYVAPFVNAEETEYLVIEDKFPNGRPELEKGGLIFTTRETVDKVEKMKVCTCLNPLHTALAVFGCLLGYDLISKEMKDETLKKLVGCLLDYNLISAEMKNETLVKLVEGIGYKEGLPVVVNPGILDPKEFIDTVLKVRVPNPFMPDTPQRIATDTSQKLAIRFGETIKAYAASPELNVSDIKLIPLVFAGWLRYLMAIDDNGNEFTLSPDPMLDEVRPYVADIKLGDSFDANAKLKDILSNAKIFGVNLYEAGLAELTCQYFTEMTRKPGAVMETLQKYVG